MLGRAPRIGCCKVIACGGLAEHDCRVAMLMKTACSPRRGCVGMTAQRICGLWLHPRVREYHRSRQYHRVSVFHRYLECNDIVENMAREILQPSACCLVSRKLLLARLYRNTYKSYTCIYVRMTFLVYIVFIDTVHHR